MAEPEPITVLRPVVRPDLSVQAYLLKEPGRALHELTSQEISERGLPAPTPEIGGGHRPGEAVM